MLEALNRDDAESAAAVIAALDPERENAFHLVIADEQTAHLVVCDGVAMTHRRLEPGLHVVTERSFGTESVAREASIRARLGVLSTPPGDSFLIDLLTSHRVASNNYGTRSSTILRVGREVRMQFADGPPDTTGFGEVDQGVAGFGVR